MDIFCSTSVLPKALQNSSNEIIWSPLLSASTIVLSAIEVSWSSLQNGFTTLKVQTFSHWIILITKNGVVSVCAFHRYWQEKRLNQLVWFFYLETNGQYIRTKHSSYFDLVLHFKKWCHSTFYLTVLPF